MRRKLLHPLCAALCAWIVTLIGVGLFVSATTGCERTISDDDVDFGDDIIDGGGGSGGNSDPNEIAPGDEI